MIVFFLGEMKQVTNTCKESGRQAGVNGGRANTCFCAKYNISQGKLCLEFVCIGSFIIAYTNRAEKPDLVVQDAITCFSVLQTQGVSISTHMICWRLAFLPCSALLSVGLLGLSV